MPCILLLTATEVRMWEWLPAVVFTAMAQQDPDADGCNMPASAHLVEQFVGGRGIVVAGQLPGHNKVRTQQHAPVGHAHQAPDAAAHLHLLFFGSNADVFASKHAAAYRSSPNWSSFPMIVWQYQGINT
jgi:hypothetical protein